MRTLPFILIATLALLPARGKNLQEQADELKLPRAVPCESRLKLPKLPGVELRLLGCDYESIISPDGRIARVLADTPVRVCFSASRDEEVVTSRDYELTVRAAEKTRGGNSKPAVIPELLQWRGGKGLYTLGDDICGPDSLVDDVAKDIQALCGKAITVCAEEKGSKASIRLHLRESEDNSCPEGYVLDIRPEQVTISATSHKGLYWGTRSLLQILRQGKGCAPCGTAVDFPRYAIRGFMLDVARLPMPLADLRAIIRTMAWYKMNELQLHLNDNYIFHEHYVKEGRDPFMESYAAFRLESRVKGKNGTPLTAQDLHYSKADFERLVRYARSHGVAIVPEFDTPGHALAFTRVRPDLIYQGDMGHKERRCEMLDASRPETMRFVTSVWDEFLLPDKKQRKRATFAGCPTVHVGADEFFGSAEDYRSFADGLLRHILKRGYTPRIWGSLNAKPGNTPVVAEGVQMNMWSGQWAKAWDSIRQGYDIINTDDGALYIVPFAGYYRMDRNHKGIYEKWQVNEIHGQRIPSGHPQLLGAMFAIWNDESDMRHRGYMAYDYWSSITGSLDVLGERMWGQAKPPRSFDEHRELVKTLGPAPRTDFLQRESAEQKQLELTPDDLPHKLGLGSLGPAYHLTMELTLAKARKGEEQVLLDSPAGQLLAVDAEGCIGFRRADSMRFSFAGARLPKGKRVRLELIGKPGSTQLLLDGEPAGTLTLKNRHNRTNELISTFILPLDTLGRRFHGSIHSLKLTPTE